MSFLFPTDEPKAVERVRAITVNTFHSAGFRGAGIDALVFDAQHVDLETVVTAIDAYTNDGFSRMDSTAGIVERQASSAKGDVVKFGLVASQPTLEAAASAFIEKKLVTCPSFFTKHGASLAPTTVVDAWRLSVMQTSDVAILNHVEASALADRTVESPGQMKDAAKAIADLGARCVVITGGHLDGIVRDFCYDGSGIIEFGADQVRVKHLRGAGCAHSAYVTARISHGDGTLDALERGREWITLAIQNARETPYGHLIDHTVSL